MHSPLRITNMLTFREMLDMQPLPFKRLDESRAIFSMDDVEYGIFVDYLDLTIKNRTLDEFSKAEQEEISEKLGMP